jgi:hypothetical protein
MFRMMSLMSTLVALGLVSAGCEQQSDSSSPEKPQAAQSTDNHDEHDHASGDAHEDEHAGHDHGDDDHAHGGEPLELGTRDIGDFTVEVVQFGAATDDAAELIFEIEIDGTASPDAVRVLVRSSDGTESLKVKANSVGKHAYDVHVGELPSSLGAGGTVIVEIESASGTNTGEFEIRHEETGD